MSYPQHRSMPPMAPRYRSSAGHQVIAWILTILTAGGLLPWAIAATRSKRNVALIAVINILGVASFIGLIWFGIGAVTFGIVWIICLIMACMNDRR